MKKLIALLGLIAFAASAQTNTNTVPPGQFTDWLNFIHEGTNFVTAVYGLVTTDKNLHGGGGGVALGYRVSDLLVPVMRIDYLNRAFYQGSLNLELQAPITLATNWTVVPFGIAGGAVPFGGGTSGASLTAQGIVGAGLALRLDFLGGIGKKMDVVLDWEKWSAIPGNQYRGGIAWKFW